MNNRPAIVKLQEYLTELESLNDFDSVEARANHIGLVNRIDTSIQLLELCEKHGILPGSLVSVLPDTENVHFTYLVVHENETSNPDGWEEVLFEDRQVRFSSGDLVIRK